MLKKLALATAVVGLLMSTASADYYIVQEKATKKCKVVETKPGGLQTNGASLSDWGLILNEEI